MFKKTLDFPGIKTNLLLDMGLAVERNYWIDVKIIANCTVVSSAQVIKV
jgi:hypothetical protein